MPVFLDGHHLITPTSTAKTGTGSTATINTNGSVTFSSCATLSLNGVFSADYDNYIIMVRGDVGAFVAVEARLRLNGTDDSTANSYVRQGLFGSGTSVTSSRVTANHTRLGNVDSTQKFGVVVHLYGPFLAQPTAIRSIGALDLSSAYIEDYATTHNQSVAYDGLTLYPSASTFEGLVCVYGAVK